jgi:hypothetical protein
MRPRTGARSSRAAPRWRDATGADIVPAAHGAPAEQIPAAGGALVSQFRTAATARHNTGANLTMAALWTLSVVKPPKVLAR